MWDVFRELMLEEVHRAWRRFVRRVRRAMRMPSRSRPDTRTDSSPLDPSAKA